VVIEESKSPLRAPKSVGDLQAMWEAEQSTARAMVAGEGAVVVGVLFAAAFGWVEFPLEYWFVPVVAATWSLRPLLDFLFDRSKPLRSLKPGAAFGVHDRDSLLRLVERAKDRWAASRVLPKLSRRELDRTDVRLVADRSPNAHSLRFDWVPGLPMYRRVTLNRSLAHVLDDDELMSVLGHEWGHGLVYVPVVNRWMALHVVWAGIVSWALAARLSGFSDAAPFLVPAVVLWLQQRVLFSSTLTMSRVVELLCDDVGACLAGGVGALKTELKMAVQGEVHESLSLVLLQAQAKGTVLTPDDVMKLYEEAVPYGRADEAVVRARLSTGLAKRKAERRGLSLKGFLAFLSDAEASADAANETLSALKRHRKKLESKSLVSFPREALFDPEAHVEVTAFEQVIEEVRAGAVVARTEAEITGGSTHPSAANRIAFLLHNRARYER